MRVGATSGERAKILAVDDHDGGEPSYSIQLLSTGQEVDTIASRLRPCPPEPAAAPPAPAAPAPAPAPSPAPAARAPLGAFANRAPERIQWADLKQCASARLAQIEEMQAKSRMHLRGGDDGIWGCMLTPVLQHSEGSDLDEVAEEGMDSWGRDEAEVDAALVTGYVEDLIAALYTPESRVRSGGADARDYAVMAYYRRSDGVHFLAGAEQLNGV
jgi:hypothetical protein